MENEMWTEENYKPFTKYGLMNICKETYKPPIS
jgi:hypothetical protein